MNFFKKVKDIKEKSVAVMEEHKPHRRPKEKRKLPLAKKVGFWKVVIWSVIIVVGTSGVLALARAQNALGKSKQAIASVKQLQGDTTTPKQDAYSSPKVEIYANTFIDTYMNVPKENREKRQEELSKWYAKGLKVDEIKNFTGYRKLKHKTLYDVQSQKGYMVLQYKVVYENVTIEKGEEPQPQTDPTQPPPPPKAVEKEKKTEHTVLLNIPISAKEGKYAVVENPYMTSAEQLQSNKIDTIQNPMNKKDQAPLAEKEKIESWLKEFFVKYADSKVEDMTYMMEEPKALNGVKTFVTIQDIKVYKTNEKNTWTVKTTVVFKEKEIDLENKEVYTMKLQLKEGKYFIEKMTHTLGGNE
ncbi:conjugal transfer protein [Bacillus cereus]|uniref:conjugal transfer protein n=1 Tax=Bacillus cereus TaxID=1396 RepID=UPI000951E8E9|nr:conjugal transfer protein [Bacillus cereus]OLR25069.1 hypothetical protein BLD50_14175 [Bacillus cereus]